MSGLSSLWNDALGVKSLVLLIAATVLCALGSMTIDQWTAFVQVIFGLYAGGTAIQNIGTAIATRPPAPPVTTPVAGPAVAVVTQ